MKKTDLLNDDFFDNEIAEFLNCYTAEQVPEEKIDLTIDSLRKYMPPKKTKNRMVEIIRNEITYIDKFHFIAALILVVAGLSVSMVSKVSMYNVLMIISPIPMIIGMFELVKSKKDNMWEIEKSCKYSYSKIVLARLIIITSFSVIINIGLLIIYGYGASGDMLCRMLFSIIVPVCTIASINLFLLGKVNSSNSLIATLIVWVSVIGTSKLVTVPYLEEAKIMSLIITIVVSMGVFAFTAYEFYCKSIKFEGDEMLWN
ncbi:hypothetical protein [Clostridium sp.]|uniref:hypothetical protein n=1 Tax=Clostridium sp. TaxID=1506 RepID=UPI0032174C8B